jgi:hypothetical protein
MDVGRRWILSISGGVTETVHTYAVGSGLAVMLKPDEEAPFRPNKARLRRIFVLLSRYLEMGLMVLTVNPPVAAALRR